MELRDVRSRPYTQYYGRYTYIWFRLILCYISTSCVKENRCLAIGIDLIELFRLLEKLANDLCFGHHPLKTADEK